MSGDTLILLWAPLKASIQPETKDHRASAKAAVLMGHPVPTLLDPGPICGQDVSGRRRRKSVLAVQSAPSGFAKQILLAWLS